MFIITSVYLKPNEEVDVHLKAHREFLDAQYEKGLFLASGRKVPRTGGVIFAKGVSRTEIEAVMAQDPFVINGCAQYDIVEFDPVKVAPGLEQLL